MSKNLTQWCDEPGRELSVTMQLNGRVVFEVLERLSPMNGKTLAIASLSPSRVRRLYDELGEYFRDCHDRTQNIPCTCSVCGTCFYFDRLNSAMPMHLINGVRCDGSGLSPVEMEGVPRP